MVWRLCDVCLGCAHCYLYRCTSSTRSTIPATDSSAVLLLRLSVTLAPMRQMCQLSCPLDAPLHVVTCDTYPDTILLLVLLY